MELLPALPDNHVQCVVTSPPYWGLRKYGEDPREIGSEKTFKEYVTKLTAVFEEVRRVLRPDGTLWLNMGDSYAGGGRGDGAKDCKQKTNHGSLGFPRMKPMKGFKPKDLIGQPWAVAFALREAGWYLRQDIIWFKKNPMPESCTDRPTRTHEYFFLMSKSQMYYYDYEAIKEPAGNRGCPTVGGNGANEGIEHSSRYNKGKKIPAGWDLADGSHGKIHREGRNSRMHVDRDVAHANRLGPKNRNADKSVKATAAARMGGGAGWRKNQERIDTRNKRSVWELATMPFLEAHYATFPPALVLPAVLAGSRPGDLVMDPFSGAGTVGKVCLERARKYLGIELYAKNLEITDRRMAKTQPGLALS